MESHRVNNVALNAHSILRLCASTTNEGTLTCRLITGTVDCTKLRYRMPPERLRSLQEEKHSKLTIGAFFEFIRTAYQVSDTCEGLDTILSTNSEIDWHELAKINLDQAAQDDKVSSANCNLREQRSDNPIQDLLLQARSKKVAYPYSTVLESLTRTLQSSATSCSINRETPSDPKADAALEKSKSNADNASVKYSKAEESVKATNDGQERTPQAAESVEETEHGLGKLMKENLRDILHEGLLDSVLPYMLPKSALSQPVIKKSSNAVLDIKRNSSLDNVIEGKLAASVPTEKEKEKNKISKKSSENEIEIHVCDRDNNIKRNFRCPQKLLVQKMCYFADVMTSRKVDEIDISVHCDVVIFDWLMRWVKKDMINTSEWPVLDAINVIPIMISACFLQMEPLLETCLQYCHDNVSEILKISSTLSCLDDNLLMRLAALFTNEDVEALKDKKDKIQSRLFCTLITSLAEITPDNKKGHYSSLATLFKCGKCNKIVMQSISESVPCVPSAMRVDTKGAVQSKHVRDLTWTLNDYVVTLRSELRSWRKVYWKLWGDCHFLLCQQCNVYFPVHQINWCCYHPELAQFFVDEQQRSTPFPLGRYPCCSQRAYRFEALSNQGGCRYKEHAPDIRSEKELSILNILTAHREIITIEPPQLFFPEKITRLDTRDSSLRSGKLACKDTMWWHGIELVPQRPKLGLLGRLWGGSRCRRSLQAQDSQRSLQKIRRQISTTTVSSSAPSIGMDEDEEDDDGTVCEESSVDEESCYTEESSTLCVLKPMGIPKRLNSHKSSARYWSDDLSVRRNQDNQRDFEERAAAQMIALLTKRTGTENLLSKSFRQQHGCKQPKQPIGGTYVKLEAEFREQLAQSSKYKNLSTGKAHVKSNKF